MDENAYYTNRMKRYLGDAYNSLQTLRDEISRVQINLNMQTNIDLEMYMEMQNGLRVSQYALNHIQEKIYNYLQKKEQEGD